jgi:hypothetical protein
MSPETIAPENACQAWCPASLVCRSSCMLSRFRGHGRQRSPKQSGRFWLRRSRGPAPWPPTIPVRPFGRLGASEARWALFQVLFQASFLCCIVTQLVVGGDVSMTDGDNPEVSVAPPVRRSAGFADPLQRQADWLCHSVLRSRGSAVLGHARCRVDQVVGIPGGERSFDLVGEGEVVGVGQVFVRCHGVGVFPGRYLPSSFGRRHGRRPTDSGISPRLSSPLSARRQFLPTRTHSGYRPPSRPGRSSDSRSGEGHLLPRPGLGSGARPGPAMVGRRSRRRFDAYEPYRHHGHWSYPRKARFRSESQDW